MKKTALIMLILLLTSNSYSQKNYFVAKDGTADFSTISQVNAASLNAGDVVCFKGGERFADAILKCKEGVIYTSFGTGRATIGDSLGNASTEATIQVNVENVTIDNLKIYGYKYSWTVISYSKGNLIVQNCEIVGGLGAHEDYRYGIYQSNHSESGGRNLTFQRNLIYGFGGAGIYISRPYNTDISYNELYDFWRTGAVINTGGVAINRATFTDGKNPEDVWDCAYTVIIHHNNIHHFEMAAFTGYSRIIYEYNEIHHNLDERIYMGGAKHGSVGKLWDNYGTSDAESSLGSLGMIFRYNYIHDLKRYGEPNHTYGLPTQWNRENGIPNIISTSNGTNRPIYTGANTPLSGLTGDDYDGAPDMLISGLGYGNYWIHNNIFYNCSNQMPGRPYNYKKDWHSELVSYFVNNTIINCGWQEHVTSGNGLFITQANSQSPHVMANNIIDYTLKGARYAGRWREQDLYLGYNIYLNQSGTTQDFPAIGDNKASFFEYDAKEIAPVNEQYLVNHSDIWNDTSSVFFASNIGVNGVYIPDVRLKVNGAAHNTGKAYITLGDNYSVQSTYWSETHTLGQDPTGRSFAYDILGNLRTTNDRGAIGVGDNSGIIPQTGLRVLLEGCYINGKMRTDLNSINFIPLLQPYSVNPWNVYGDVILNNVSTNYVDWVLVQTRENMTDTRYSKVGILTEDGQVVNPDGSPFSFTNLPTSEYYLVIKHRNHLGIMSAQKIFIGRGEPVEYDFTNSPSKAFGDNAMVNLGDESYAMIAGDGNADGIVNVLDFGSVANNILSRGYSLGDMDMNGVINVLDYSFISRNLLKKSNLP